MTKDEVKRLDDQGLAAWNKHDPDAFLSLLADDFVWYDWTTPKPMRDKEAARAYFNSWMTAFPDMRVQRVYQVVGNDAVAAELKFTGTNSGPMEMGGNRIPPTNRSVNGRGTYIARIRDGRIVEFRTFPDVAGLMMQLGLMPPM